MINKNLCISNDSYKQTHHFQYPPGLQRVYSYMEPRIGSEYDDIVWMGAIPYLKEYGLIDQAFDVWDIIEAVRVCNDHFGVKGYFNEDGWIDLYQAYKGCLPLRVYQLPAGTIIKPGTPCMAIENTDDRFPWLTNFVESITLHPWGMTTTATKSYDIYKVIKKWADRTGEEVSPYHLNDFGVRGTTSLQSSMLNGVGHLAIFRGTDNLPAIKFIKDNYTDHAMVGESVIAAEHSTIMAWGPEREGIAYRHIIEESDRLYSNNGENFIIISIVIDTYNWKNALDKYFCGELVDLIKNRNGRITIRLDSGDLQNGAVYTLWKLWDHYGGTVNEKGYKILDPHVGIIIGDGVIANSIDKIYNYIYNEGFGIGNIIFGCGGEILQKINRDTLNVAIKLSEVKINDQVIPMCKTSSGKVSKAGRFDNLELIYENGVLLKDESFTDIRKRIQDRL